MATVFPNDAPSAPKPEPVAKAEPPKVAEEPKPVAPPTAPPVVAPPVAEIPSFEETHAEALRAQEFVGRGA